MVRTLMTSMIPGSHLDHASATSCHDPSRGSYGSIKLPVTVGDPCYHQRVRLKQYTPSTDEYCDLLHRHFPCAGYWLNLLPAHLHIHSSTGWEYSLISILEVYLLCLARPWTSRVPKQVMVQPCQFSAPIADLTGNYSELCTHLQPVFFGPASGNGWMDNVEGMQNMVFDWRVMN